MFFRKYLTRNNIVGELIVFSIMLIASRVFAMKTNLPSIRLRGKLVGRGERVKSTSEMHQLWRVASNSTNRSSAFSPA